MIGCIIQARTGSTRLPGKTMMSIDQNDTVLSFGIKQVKSCKKIDELVIATTDLPEDNIIVDYMNKLTVTILPEVARFCDEIVDVNK